MVNDIVDELMDLDMEPKRELLWRTITYKAEVGVTLEVGGRGKSWEMPFVEVFDLCWGFGSGFSKNRKDVEKKQWGVGGGIHTSTERRACR